MTDTPWSLFMIKIGAHLFFCRVVVTSFMTSTYMKCLVYCFFFFPCRQHFNSSLCLFSLFNFFSTWFRLPFLFLHYIFFSRSVFIYFFFFLFSNTPYTGGWWKILIAFRHACRWGVLLIPKRLYLWCLLLYSFLGFSDTPWIRINIAKLWANSTKVLKNIRTNTRVLQHHYHRLIKKKYWIEYQRHTYDRVWRNIDLNSIDLQKSNQNWNSYTFAV